MVKAVESAPEPEAEPDVPAEPEPEEDVTVRTPVKAKHAADKFDELQFGDNFDVE